MNERAERTLLDDLEEILQDPIRPKKGAEYSGMQRLARIVRRAPEVVIKIKRGDITSRGVLNARIAYQTKSGKLDAINERGDVIEGSEALRDETLLWTLEAAVRKQRKNAGPIARHVIFSMPQNRANPPDLLKAVQDFGQVEFANHPHMMVLHTHQENPHVHVLVACTGFDGRRLSHSKEDLQRWRKVFAERLRARGIEAEASPKRARGVVLKSRPQAIHHITQKGPGAVRVDNERAMDIAREVIAQAGRGHRPWETAIKDRQARVRGAYERIAKRLDQMPQPEAQTLAHGIRGFVAQMPPPETRREIEERQAREIMGRGRGR